jgi:hypothetical protein
MTFPFVSIPIRENIEPFYSAIYIFYHDPTLGQIVVISLVFVCRGAFLGLFNRREDVFVEG